MIATKFMTATHAGDDASSSRNDRVYCSLFPWGSHWQKKKKHSGYSAMLNSLHTSPKAPKHVGLRPSDMREDLPFGALETRCPLSAHAAPQSNRGESLRSTL